VYNFSRLIWFDSGNCLVHTPNEREMNRTVSISSNLSCFVVLNLNLSHCLKRFTRYQKIWQENSKLYEIYKISLSKMIRYQSHCFYHTHFLVSLLYRIVSSVSPPYPRWQMSLFFRLKASQWLELVEDTSNRDRKTCESIVEMIVNFESYTEDENGTVVKWIRNLKRKWKKSFLEHSVSITYYWLWQFLIEEYSFRWDYTLFYSSIRYNRIVYIKSMRLYMKLVDRKEGKGEVTARIDMREQWDMNRKVRIEKKGQYENRW